MTDETTAAGTCALPGGCACGAVRYTVQAPAMIVHCCHCSWCQRESGSAFVINGLIERDRITLQQGNVHSIDTPTPSGQGQGIIRCSTVAKPELATHLWSDAPTDS